MSAAADALMGIFGMKRVNTHKCKICKQPFVRSRPLQAVCSTECAIEQAKDNRDKKLEQQAREKRKEIKDRKEAVKRTCDLKAEAQAAFNAYIRARDAKAGYPCICCGKPFEPQRPGGSIDAGHYLSRGSAPHLRFDERNVHAQRKNCNRPGGTTAAAFRLGMIARIGIDEVEALEADQEQRRYRAEDYRRIKDEYKAKLKALKAAHD